MLLKKGLIVASCVAALTFASSAFSYNGMLLHNNTGSKLTISCDGGAPHDAFAIRVPWAPNTLGLPNVEQNFLNGKTSGTCDFFDADGNKIGSGDISIANNEGTLTNVSPAAGYTTTVTDGSTNPPKVVPAGTAVGEMDVTVAKG